MATGQAEQAVRWANHGQTLGWRHLYRCENRKRCNCAKERFRLVRNWRGTSPGRAPTISGDAVCV